MLFDSLPRPLRDAVYAAVGLPVVLAEELTRATRRIHARLTHAA